MIRTRALVLALLVVLPTGGWLLAAKKPPPPAHPKHKPPPRHPHAKEIAELTQQIASLHREMAGHLARIQGGFHAEVRKLDGGKVSLESQLVKLRQEEWAALKKAFDVNKMRAIEARYDAKVAELMKLIRIRDAKLAELRRKRRAEVAAVWADYWRKIHKLDDPDGNLEVKLNRLWTDQWTALVGLLEPGQRKVYRVKYTTEVAAVERRIAQLPQRITAVQEQEQKAIAAAQTESQDQIAKIDRPEDAPEGALEDVQARQQAEMADNSSGDAQQSDQSAYADQVSDLQEQVKARDEQVAALKDQFQGAVTGVQSEYQAKFEALNPPDNPLLDQLVTVRTQQRDAIVEVVDTAKAQAILADYGPRIAKLEERIRFKHGEMAKFWSVAWADVAKIDAAYGARIAKLDRREDRAEYKIARLRNHERIELARLAGWAKVRAIEHHYEPHIRDLIKRIAHKQKAVAVLAQRTRGEMTKVAAHYRGRILALERRRQQLMHSR